MKDNIFREYDIRGKYPSDINADVAYKIGLGYKANFDNLNKVNVTGSMTTFDENGKIVTNRMDKVYLNLQGDTIKNSITIKNLDINEEYVKTVLEEGKEYTVENITNMAEQIESFNNWSIGKTINEIKSFSETKNGQIYLKENTIKKVTMPVGDLIATLDNAYTTKDYTIKDLDLNAKTGIAISARLANDNSLTASHIVDVDIYGTLVKDNKVVAASFDSLSFDFNVNNENGTLTLNDKSQSYDKDNFVKSNKFLKDSYVFANDNKNILRWYKQANIIEQNIIGKTSSEIVSLDMSDKTFKDITIETNMILKGLARATNYATNPITK